MANVYAKLGNLGGQSATSLDKIRRIYNFGDRVAELAIAESPFFVYLSKVSKVPTDDPVFKFLEQRHQWQRRNFFIKAAVNTTALGSITSLDVQCYYDKYGRYSESAQYPEFFINGQVISVAAINDDDGSNTILTFKVGVVTDNTTYASIAVTGLAANGDTTSGNWATSYTIAAFKKGQVIGSAWAEGGTDPDGWRDELYDREGYCQIFKTAIPLFSGTALATRYRGVANEWQRVWREKLKEHKMDLEHTSLFGVGKNDTTNNLRYSWGIIPYTEMYGQVFNYEYDNSDYDDFLDDMEAFFAPEEGNSGDKLVLASRKIIKFFNKLGSGGFLHNTVGSDQYRLDVQNIQGKFGHNVTKVSTVFGNLHFVQEPLLRGLFEDYAIAVDLKNVKFRPLKANGYSRDTQIITNVQNNNVDGRKDMVLTEAGVEVQLPRTHALMKFA